VAQLSDGGVLPEEAGGPPRRRLPHPPRAPLVVVPPVRLAPAAVSAGKRAFDVVAAALALVVLTPLLLVVGTLVACTSPGPVLYRQIRVGAGGRQFTMLKFRSMYDGAHVERHRLRHLNEASGPLFKMRHDPRLTPLGRWMRRYSADELPQMWNVLVGSMSLVGPRPALPEECALFAAEEHGRHAVRPGLTGLAQVSGRSELPWSRSVALDLRYVEECSWRLDLAILVRTVRVVLLGRGAY